MTDDKEFRLLEPELEGEIYYLTEQEGGRFSYVKSGYRGQFHYNGRDWDAPQEFIDKDICNPGETVKVKLQTLSPFFHVGQFSLGQEFETREGARTVGKGKITKILRQDFTFWTFDTFFNQLPDNCKPCDWGNIGGFITDLEYGLESIRQIQSLKFTKSLSDKYQMLIVECKVKNKNVSARPLIDEICENWRTGITFKNALYKTKLTYFDNHFKFHLTFATWNSSMCLTGKIIVDTA